ncbi:hypothetical protein NDU88_005028 [Pleurodeles waltl]|uniref:Uncharacterized protein n=1 Tax=Pleurodeles waltl TaxID=8319 RepID=A0AAV7V2V7_PLEWA|nr:hypothetical protein NDU88_005028 [Pleurodeles waltl]
MDTEHHSNALYKVTETLAAHSTQMEKVLQAILDTKTSLEGKIDTVVAEVNILRMEHRKLANRVTTTETTLNTAQPDIADMKLRLQHQKSEILRLHKCADEAEGRSRRNNVRFLGFPEKIELPNAESFIESWLKENIFTNETPPLLLVERAHRIPGGPPRPGPPPTTANSEILKLLRQRPGFKGLSHIQPNRYRKYKNHGLPRLHCRSTTQTCYLQFSKASTKRQKLLILSNVPGQTTSGGWRKISHISNIRRRMDLDTRKRASRPYS